MISQRPWIFSPSNNLHTYIYKYHIHTVDLQIRNMNMVSAHSTFSKIKMCKIHESRAGNRELIMYASSRRSSTNVMNDGGPGTMLKGISKPRKHDGSCQQVYVYMCT